MLLRMLLLNAAVYICRSLALETELMTGAWKPRSTSQELLIPSKWESEMLKKSIDVRERERGFGFCIPHYRRVPDTTANAAAGGWWDRDSWGVGRSILTGVCGDTLRKDWVCVQVPKYQNIHDVCQKPIGTECQWVSYAGSTGRSPRNNESLLCDEKTTDRQWRLLRINVYGN